MQNSKVKLIFLVGVFLILSCIFGIKAYAANENLQIVKITDSKYLIYVKGNLDSSFEFAFADTTTEPATSEYKDAAKDTAEDGNYIAYLDEYSTANKYLWAKNGDGYILEAVEVDLDKAINKADLEEIQKVTNKIAVDTEKTNVEEKEVDGNKVTVTTGKIEFKNEGTYKYQIVKTNKSEEYAEFMDLAERISKFNKDTDMYTQLEVYTKFNTLFNKLSSELENNWKEVEGKEILQPEDTKNGDKYVVWIKEGNTLDAQFLTSKYEEAKVTEKITTKLPVTYDNNTLLIVLGILIIATIVVSVRINSLKKEDK